MAPVIDCRAVTVRRRRTTVLDRVTFSVAAGEFLAIAGANGAGKTTLLLGLLGFVKPVGGVIEVFGGPPRSGRIRNGRAVGYVPQRSREAVGLPLRVRDVVAIGRCAMMPPGRRLRAADRAAIDAAMNTVHIGHLADRPFAALSGGERQRTQLARVLAQDADLLLLDEPAAGLDLGVRAEIFELIETLRASRTLTVLLVMHELACLPRQCHRALVLDRGRLAWDGNAEHLFSPLLLSMIYGTNADRVRKVITGGPACWS